MNCLPWSDEIFFTWPYLGMYLFKTFNTAAMVGRPIAYRLTCLENASVHTTRFFIPLDARGSGPKKSIHNRSFLFFCNDIPHFYIGMLIRVICSLAYVAG